METLQLGSVSVDVERKNIRNIHVTVYPPNGRVRVSAPLRMDLDAIRIYAISKLGWIKKRQEKLKSQKREAPGEFLNGEIHYFNGERYSLKVSEVNAPPRVELSHGELLLYTRPNSTVLKRETILNEWYRSQLKKVLPALIEKWEKILDVKISAAGVKKMKTRWGSCNAKAKRIWLNLELAKKPRECLEYVVVHEMTHLLERTHNDKFIARMDKFLPKWRFYKDELNRLPVKYENSGSRPNLGA